MGGDAHPNERRVVEKGIVLGNIEIAVRIRQDGKEKVWISCLQNDVRASGIAGGWKATVLETGMRVKTVTEGGRWLISA